MNTTERNWSSVCCYDGTGWGLRSFLTRQEWIDQCIEWSQDKVYDEVEGDGEEDYIDGLNAMNDGDLMLYIQETWGIEIIETTWLKVGNECVWHRHEGDVIVKILEIPDEELTGWSAISIDFNGRQYSLPLHNLYGLTGETCHKCGHPLYVSDLCQYMYVCLECDENFC